MKKEKKIFIILFILILIAQLISKIYVDLKKEDFFIDEFYSYALMNYKIPFIFQEETFLDTWHDNEYFKDYVSISEDEMWDWRPVYTNQVADVHPPFYYLLLRIFATFSVGTFSKWPGLILNLVIYIFSAIVFYKISEKLLKNKWYALIALFAYGFSVFSTENTLYIRMYQLLELSLLLITYWHIKNYDQPLKISNLVLLMILAVLGFLTHYYYIFFLIVLYFIYLFKYIKSKDIKSILKYTGTLLMSGALILLIFPYCLSHIFCSYRGANSLFRLFDFSNSWYFIKEYLKLIDDHIFVYGFGILIGILILIKLFLLIYSSIKAKQFKLKLKKELIFIVLPSLVYILFIMKTSPFIDIRYLSPVLVYILLFIVYLMKSILDSILPNKNIGIIATAIILIAFTVPSFFSHERLPYLYNGNKKVFDDLKENYGSLPCIYIYYETTEMFNNFVYNYNYLLQSDNIYITERITTESAGEILEGIDTSNGIIVHDTDINLPNILRFVELEEFNRYDIIADTYNSCIFYIYYDENFPN